MCQDVLNARQMKINVSLHCVTRRDGPCYHTGVDTIDAIAYGSHKKLTENELDKVNEDFLVKEEGKSSA